VHAGEHGGFFDDCQPASLAHLKESDVRPMCGDERREALDQCVPAPETLTATFTLRVKVAL
jgi:hypothetical protein